ncbi:MAG: hypothetical protein V1866_03935 [archaeon]
MVDALLKYVDEQLKKGYGQSVIKESLIRQGYSPALVDGVMESVISRQRSTTTLIQNQPPVQGVSHEKSSFPKILLVLVVIGAVIAVAFLVPGLIRPRQALLDVKLSSESVAFSPGDEVKFTLEVTNMGSKDRFDVTFQYKVIDSDNNVISSKEETIAISTSTSYYKSVKLASGMKQGDYTLKVFANYDEKIATAAFSFTVGERKPLPVTKASCSDGIRNQDETNADCGGVCGGYWYDGKCNTKPEAGGPIQPESPKATCRDSLKNQDEEGVDCGGVCGGYWYDSGCHDVPKADIKPIEPEPTGTEKKTVAATLIDVRARALSDPAGAGQLCLGLDKTEDKDRCFKSIAETALKKEYCEYVKGIDERDRCYYIFFIQGDYTVCEKMPLVDSRKACETLRDITEYAAKMQPLMNQTNATGNQTNASAPYAPVLELNQTNSTPTNESE